MAATIGCAPGEVNRAGKSNALERLAAGQQRSPCGAGRVRPNAADPPMRGLVAVRMREEARAA